MASSRAFSYMQLANLEYIEKLYAQFIEAPDSVESTWRTFFEGMEFGAYQKLKATSPKGETDLRIFGLIEAYRRFGHLYANSNPIALETPKRGAELSPETYGFSKGDLERPFPTCGLMKEESAPLSKIIGVLEEIYCGTIGIEYMGCHSPELEKYIQSEIEPNRFKPHFSTDEKKEILRELNKAELFETFLHTKYVGQKRFSLEGGETLIPALAAIIKRGAEWGMEECVIGMAHRGRLNVLSNILNKSYSHVFSEFEDYVDPNLIDILGDVKYHKGFSSDVISGEKQVHISLTPNPSHLESVNCVTEGKARAKQVQKEDAKQNKVIAILIHGDASLAGQGVVYETLQLSQVPGYATGGTLHLVINNQIGFTTLPEEFRSSRYSTDIAHAFDSPVFHVNAEDPEGCVFAALLALKIRSRFHCDVFIEINGYRKYGHNESDEPFFTQPLEYQLIRKKKSIREIYRDRLVHESVVEQQIAHSLEEEFKKQLHFELEELKLKKESSKEVAFEGLWQEFHKIRSEELFQPIETAIPLNKLQEIGEKMCQIPENVDIHSKLKKLVEQRRNMIEQKIPLDWAMGELLAFATLLWNGTHVRLSGQDSQRGTFTQRHAVWVDQKSGSKYFPLSHLKEGQGLFDVYNSPLSEFGVLGFEFGYSLAYPSALVLWEAQFGDFVNGAQIILDQYLAASEQKWRRYSGLTLLLPHGYEGQGAEHSSARLERFLQLAAENNLQVVYPTTPSQHFHLLRRQVLRDVRLPLIVFTPKGLLRHPECVSPLEALTKGTFEEILDDPNKQAKRIILCSGRIYYDLLGEKNKRERKDVALIRLEQLYPLHHAKLVQVLKTFEGGKEFLWVQEEPKNMGAYAYMYPILYELFPDKKWEFITRKASAASAVGSHALHAKEYENLMNQAFGG